MLEKYLDIQPEVKNALLNGKPVVSLESTIISHGMPYPQNIISARKCEDIIRENGAIPATIGIIGGKIKIGLSDADLEYLGNTKGIIKTSRRDVPVIIANKLDGATTVATTMIASALAGIKVFATGGIGGAHRNAQQTFDISADLMELANTNVAVVCAGAKSILDLGLTLEYLETQGVPVLGYQTEDFPNFYTRSSGYKADYKLNSAEEAANIINTKWELGLKGGVVIANPIPAEYALDSDMINAKIEEALKEADAKGIKGKEATPFLLSKLYEITGGESLASNMQLVYNNCKVAAQIAVKLANLK
jgi:pseudouridylate synthase